MKMKWRSIIIGSAIVLPVYALLLHKAFAGLDVPPNPVNMSGYASVDAINALQQQIPQPASTLPPSEMTGGTVGTPGVYRPADARPPRITRSKTLTLDGTGTATFDWTAQGALVAPVQVATTAVYTGTGVPKCWATATSATAVSIKCVVENNTLLNLAAVTAGVNLNGISASGLTVGVIVLPAS
jgi:hypothetical protein